MLNIPGVDYADARPGGSVLKAAGKRFACRYLAYSHPSLTAVAKFLTEPEVADLHLHGIDIVANFESTSTRSSTAGAAGGSADGTDARVAMGALGFPKGCTVYCSLQDSGLSASTFPAVAAYAQAFRTALQAEYEFGGYGGTALRAYLEAHGFPAIRWWQSAALSWSGYRWAVDVDIQQRGSGTSVPGTDGDTALVADYGQWAAPQLPDTSTTGGDMIARHGGLQTGLVQKGTPYALTPGGSVHAAIGAEGRYFLTAWSPDGKFVALDGNFLATPGTALVTCGWVAASAVTDIQPAVPTLSPYHIEVTTSSATVPIVTVTKS